MRKSLFSDLPPMSGDPIFALSATYMKDPATEKVNLGMGVYRTDEGLPWVLPTVKKVERILAEDPTVDHEYPPIAGYAPFIESARDLLFGNPDPGLVSRTASIQTISGTGACHIGARFLAETLKPRRVWLSDPTWGNHHLIWDLAAGNVEQRLYPYYDSENCRFDFEGMISTLDKDAAEGDIVLLHACAHNPTGLDPTQEQWVKIADLCERKGLFPFFDSAYQGFASGDADRDAWAVRHFVGRNTMELCVAQSFSKNFGLYGQRVGAFHLVASSNDASVKALGALADYQRGEISMPPIYGARIVAKILRDDGLRKEWQQDLKTMSHRITGMRKALFDELQSKGTPGTWDHIVNQSGMFSYTGLSEEQVAALQADHHIYMLKSSRASISGLSTANVAFVARGIDTVVRATHKAKSAKNLEPAVEKKPAQAKVLIEEGDISAVQA